MVERSECVVIGAGAIGLAVARRLAMDGREVIVLEQADVIGSETSSRNSEVIHAGIYYPTGSLKARACVAGKWRLYDYCASHGIAHRNCGKLIVAACADEEPVLAEIQRRAADNGVDDLEFVGRQAVEVMEPAVACTAALLSPSTGIIDSHGLMLAYQGDAEAHGAMLAFETRLVAWACQDRGFRLTADLGGDDGGGSGGERFELAADIVVNAAGLGAPALARQLDGLDPDLVPRDYLCRGNYFSLSGRQPFTRLIYPVPRSASLGVHVTIDLGGQAKFGPDQEWIDAIDYDVDPARAEVFYAAIRRYWPGLPDGALQPAYAGIRPKIQAPDEPAKDFVVQGPATHGLAGLVNLFGIESPGLTASLALADLVAEALDGAEPGG